MKISNRLVVLIIFLVTFLVYGMSLGNDFMIGDDEDQIINNPQVHSIANIPGLFMGSTYYRAESGQNWGLFYRPLMLSVYAVIYNLAGPDPFWFHLVQVLLHAVNGVLVYVLFDKLIGRRGLALFGALVFVVHPAISEAVLSIASLQDVLFMTLGLAAILLVEKYREGQEREWLFVEVMVMTLALLAKETAAALLVIAVVYAWIQKREIWKKTALFGVAATVVYAAVRFGIARVGLLGEPVGLMTEVGFLERMMSVPMIWWTYIWKFVWPKVLVVHQYWAVREISSSYFWAPLILVLMVLGLLAWFGYWLWRKQRKDGKVYAFFGVWFVLGMLVHSQVMPLYVTVAERWFYLSIVGLIGMGLIIMANFQFSVLKQISNIKGKMTKQMPLMLGNDGVRTRFCSGARPSTEGLAPCRALFVLGGVILVLLGGRTVVRARDWRDSRTLMEHDVRLAGNGSYYLKNLLGAIYIGEKRFGEAKPYLEASVVEYLFFGNVTNLATVYMRQGELEKAGKQFARALELGQNYQTWQNYANFLTYVKEDYKKVREVSLQGRALYPQAGEMWLTLAIAEYELGNVEVASQAARQAYDLAPMPLSKVVWEQISSGRDLEIEEWIE